MSLREKRASTTLVRIEPLNFVDHLVIYTIEADVSPIRVAMHDYPEGGGDVCVTRVYREYAEVPEKDWPFSNEEWDTIERKLSEQAEYADYRDSYLDDRDDYDHPEVFK